MERLPRGLKEVDHVLQATGTRPIAGKPRRGQRFGGPFGETAPKVPFGPLQHGLGVGRPLYHVNAAGIDQVPGKSDQSVASQGDGRKLPVGKVKDGAIRSDEKTGAGEGGVAVASAGFPSDARDTIQNHDVVKIRGFPFIQIKDSCSVDAEMKVSVGEKLDDRSFRGGLFQAPDGPLDDAGHPGKGRVSVNNLRGSGVLRTTRSYGADGLCFFKGVSGDAVGKHNGPDVRSNAIGEERGCTDAEERAYPMVLGPDVYHVTLVVDPEHPPSWSVRRWVTHNSSTGIISGF